MMLKEGEKLRAMWFEAFGVSWKLGRVTLRDGKAVRCGHRHRSINTANRCAIRMKKDRPGNCQTYRASEMIEVVIKKKKA
jgi:hypothetical protein